MRIAGNLEGELHERVVERFQGDDPALLDALFGLRQQSRLIRLNAASLY